jgi:peptidyl-prolyl cis-trans isomerase A (cyclophilin A)
MVNKTRVLAMACATLVMGACGREPAGEAPRVEAPSPVDTSPGRAPDTVRVRFETNRGSFVVTAYREWAPHGVDRFHHLVRTGYYDGNRFFRVVEGFIVQFGIHGDPAVSARWREDRIPDDSVRQSNSRGTVTFAMAGPGSRTTQLFINYRDNARLDGMGFAPIGAVTDGMSVVDGFYSGYGEGWPQGSGPDQSRMQTEGNAYLERQFPRLDYIVRASVIQ